jgi:hypothetical protein
MPALAPVVAFGITSVRTDWLSGKHRSPETESVCPIVNIADISMRYAATGHARDRLATALRSIMGEQTRPSTRRRRCVS